MINVTERIGELMVLKGWTAYELSNQTGISTNAIYDWFKIGAVPTLQNIIKICEAMEISLEQFFCGGDYKYTDEENEILKEWVGLSELERSTLMNLIETFRILKNS